VSFTFRKAPLVEIVVELRWIPPHATATGDQALTVPVTVPFLSSSKLDEFFMRVGSHLYQHGFTVVERLMPPGFSVLHQPVYRYRKGMDPIPALVQAGDGIFSVHAVPPYHSWENFLPVVEQSLGALLEARDASQKSLPFVRVSLRYIDAFTAQLRSGLSASDFISKVFNVSVSVPPALSQLLKQGTAPSYAIQIGIPTKDSAQLTLNLGEASVNGQNAVLMDTTYAFTETVAADLGTIKGVLMSGYESMHRLFVDLTRPIHQAMEPDGIVE
jgi:uncharacterized protein (TIGR04255 family)